ncbi:CHAT domain-containing protein [Nostoc sp. UHCC 0926]|nr:CHAT domain-containing protein [Nostoc sp. UHCC 0926]WDD35754.1 CHAT domain-containing protein [Nostoc sp. UHCC 0926]
MPQNGFLRSHDVFNLNLQAELLVLSACKTGLGEDMSSRFSLLTQCWIFLNICYITLQTVTTATTLELWSFTHVRFKESCTYCFRRS